MLTSESFLLLEKIKSPFYRKWCMIVMTPYLLRRHPFVRKGDVSVKYFCRNLCVVLFLHGAVYSTDRVFLLQTFMCYNNVSTHQVNFQILITQQRIVVFFICMIKQGHNEPGIRQSKALLKSWKLLLWTK